MKKLSITFFIGKRGLNCGFRPTIEDSMMRTYTIKCKDYDEVADKIKEIGYWSIVFEATIVNIHINED